MKPSQTLFCKTDATVRISQSEYEDLLEYKRICQDMFELFRGDRE